MTNIRDQVRERLADAVAKRKGVSLRWDMATALLDELARVPTRDQIVALRTQGYSERGDELVKRRDVINLLTETSQ